MDKSFSETPNLTSVFEDSLVSHTIPIKRRLGRVWYVHRTWDLLDESVQKFFKTETTHVLTPATQRKKIYPVNSPGTPSFVSVRATTIFFL